jgi:hypothetical protein
MSFNVVMINADAYIGVVAAHAREVSMQSIKENDTRRLIWSKLILPTIMKKEFIDRVVASPENFCRFIIDVNGPNSPLVPSDLDHLDTKDLSKQLHPSISTRTSRACRMHISRGWTSATSHCLTSARSLRRRVRICPTLLRYPTRLASCACSESMLSSKPQSSYPR